MAPTKFGLFKTRSRDHQEQPSTENLLQSNSSDVGTPGSPVASTSKGMTEDLTPEDISDLHIDSEDDEEEGSENQTPVRRRSQIMIDDTQVHYRPLKHRSSIDTLSTLTLQELQPHYDELEDVLGIDNDGASTSADCNSLQMDESSIAPSEDISVYCGPIKKPKKMRSWEMQQIRDLDMWRASNVEVMQNLLSRRGTHDEQIKWEAIATARGLCTLTDSCTCSDCKRTKYLAGITDGDGGLGAAPLFSAISVGCSVQ